MGDRKRKVEELVEGLMSLKHRIAFSSHGSHKNPRITPAQWGVLMCVGHADTSTVKDVAGALSITSSAATQLIDGLVKNGYVERVADVRDRRAVALTLSKKTKGRVAAMKEAAIGQFLKLFESFTDKEFELYCALSKKVVRAADH